jgi:hypothetical protein
MTNLMAKTSPSPSVKKHPMKHLPHKPLDSLTPPLVSSPKAKKDWKPMEHHPNKRETPPPSRNSPTTPTSSRPQTATTHLKGTKFRDPYEVFRRVFREEFGEEFVPGQRPQAACIPKPTRPESMRNTRVKTPPKDDRALSGKTKTKQILHDNGEVETITTTVITRPNGQQERVVKSSMEKLSKAEQAKLPKATTVKKKKKTTRPPSQTRTK